MCTDSKSQGPAAFIDPALDPTSGDIPGRSSIVSTPLFASSEADDMSAENKTTVIVGAGSIGLWTAYHLAHANRRTGLSSSNTIIVIEASATAFGETSGTCTGCIHYTFNDDIMNEFRKYSFAAWRDLAESNDLCDTAGLRFDSIFGLTKNGGVNQELLPDWLRTSDAWGVDTEFLGVHNAMVNPVGLGKWLERACIDMNVRIETSTKVTAVELDERNRATAVIVIREDSSSVRIPCDNFVLAGGPWTPMIYKTLFPSSPIHIDSATEAGDWIVFRNQNPVAKNSVAFVGLNDIVGEKLEFAGRNDGTIWVCGAKDLKGTLPPLGSRGLPDAARIAELTGHAYRFLRVHNAGDPDAFEELEVVALGRAFRPVTLSGRPMMALVEPDKLSRHNGHHPDERRGNVFLCWGHGSWGLTLGPGTGKLMSQMILGEPTDLDLSPFQIPETM
ncbi:uncharacterized protein J4E88_002721 [Alternaria novae-zelandiae]|uniref:uncharacterized protein n=1 Tax=Alternaria novae-zelandiae TaxID=430562 RepID=UPI0020C2DD4C|nr:uncharacterized protein J4E88_002721 [Alternaria novae-zelandiae]KAI4689369.1 hypothetical protein J4E88_002721 [Alternaria novae-zelandiae]